MASKEAQIYIVDQGKTTEGENHGRRETDLEYAMTYVWDKITSAMATGRKTFNIGVIGLRTDDTNIPYEQGKSDGFENLSIQKELGQVLMADLRNLQQVIRPSSSIAGDALSAIALAVDLVNKYTRNTKGVPLKYERKIVLVTDGKGPIEYDAAFINGLTLQINQSDIELVVLGVDFDDPEYGFKEEDKDIIKNQNEAILRGVVADCAKGSYGTIAEALEDIAIPRPKNTKPYRSYLGKLTLGNLVEYPETAVSIDVERYFRTKSAKPPSASSFAVRPDTANGQASTQSTHTMPDDTDMPDVPPEGGPMTAVKSLRTYQVKLEQSVIDVSPEELEKGYEYGSTAVHIAVSDENITKLETIQSFSIIGFIPMDKYEKYLNMGESCVIIAQQTNDKARMALSSLIHALFELESYAVARIVLKDGKDPAIVLLAPSIEPELESLIDVPLPFAEDVRPYRFPPLDRVITTTGAILDKHRNLPSKDLMDSMSDYVDSMDLSTFGRDDEGEPTEYMTFDESYSPLIHRLDQAIRKRASHPDEGIKPVPDVLMKWTAPPPKLVKQSQSQLNKLTKAADVKKVPPKAKGKRGGREKIKPLSGLDIDALLSSKGEQQKIAPENSIPEFKRMLANSNADSVVEDAAKQMGKIIINLLSGAHLAMGTSGDDRALENLRVMREEMINFEFDETYNKFIRNLKSKVAKEDGLGGSVKEFWFKVKSNHLGLINNKEGSSSKVDEQEANEFYLLRSELPTRSKS